jgi:hypothetical protein
MDWVKKQYKDAFFPIIIMSSLMAFFFPLSSGPVWFNIVGTFLGSYLYITLWLAARVLWATASKKINQNND